MTWSLGQSNSLVVIPTGTKAAQSFMNAPRSLMLVRRCPAAVLADPCLVQQLGFLWSRMKPFKIRIHTERKKLTTIPEAGAGEVIQYSRALAGRAKDLGSVPNPHIGQLTTHHNSFRWIWYHLDSADILYTYRQAGGRKVIGVMNQTSKD